MGQLTGRVFIKINGKDMRSKEGATLNPGGVERSPAMSDRGVDGYTESPVAPKVSFTLNERDDVSQQEIADITDATILFERDTGKSSVIRSAWCDGPVELSGGELSCSFTGVSCEEVS